MEFFLTHEGVVFSELSPRPHDTGLVTLAGTQRLNEFELHARAVLGLPIEPISLRQAGASAVILADREGIDPDFEGVESAMEVPDSEIRLFGKPTTRPHRRMGVATVSGPLEADMDSLREQARKVAGRVSVTSKTV